MDPYASTHDYDELAGWPHALCGADLREVEEAFLGHPVTCEECDRLCQQRHEKH